MTPSGVLDRIAQVAWMASFEDSYGKPPDPSHWDSGIGYAALDEPSRNHWRAVATAVVHELDAIFKEDP
jgi:hypothetical protein